MDISNVSIAHVKYCCNADKMLPMSRYLYESSMTDIITICYYITLKHYKNLIIV